MKLEQVNEVMMNGGTVVHTQAGMPVRYRITGVLTRYTQKGWTYSLELTDLNTPCVVYAALDDVEVEHDR